MTAELLWTVHSSMMRSTRMLSAFGNHGRPNSRTTPRPARRIIARNPSNSSPGWHPAASRRNWLRSTGSRPARWTGRSICSRKNPMAFSTQDPWWISTIGGAIRELWHGPSCRTPPRPKSTWPARKSPNALPTWICTSSHDLPWPSPKAIGNPPRIGTCAPAACSPWARPGSTTNCGKPAPQSRKAHTSPRTASDC